MIDLKKMPKIDREKIEADFKKLQEETIKAMDQFLIPITVHYEFYGLDKFIKEQGKI